MRLEVKPPRQRTFHRSLNCEIILDGAAIFFAMSAYESAASDFAVNEFPLM
jgi:hypothetical protein